MKDRHQCEVRACIRMTLTKGREATRDYLATVEKKRGQESADLLRTDVLTQWKAGNRGTEGEWK